MQNFFSYSTRHKRTELLKPGSYQVELMAIRPAPSRDFGDGKPPRERLTFCFKTKVGDAPINRTLTASTDTRSRLIEFVKQLAGHEFPSSEIVDDGAKFSAYLQGLVGKQFTASVAPSPNGRFNDIVSISSSKLGEVA